MGQPHRRKTNPISGGRHGPGRPRVGTRSRGLGHQLGTGVTSYLVRTPDLVSRATSRPECGAASGRGLGHQLGTWVTSYVVRGPDEVSGGPTGCPRVRARTRPRELAPAALADQPGRLIRPRGIRVAASFPGRGGGCQGSRSRRDAEGALDTHHLDLDNPAAETAQPGEPPGHRRTRCSTPLAPAATQERRPGVVGSGDVGVEWGARSTKKPGPAQRDWAGPGEC